MARAAIAREMAHRFRLVRPAAKATPSTPDTCHSHDPPQVRRT